MELSSWQKLKLDGAPSPMVLSNDEKMRIRIYIFLNMLRKK